VTDLALSLYRAAARALLPSAFMEEYGAELADTVAARLAAARGPLGPWPALGVELADLLGTALRERLVSAVDGRAADTGGNDRTVRPEARMGAAWADWKTSVRSLGRRPWLSLGVTLMVGLGIGATTTIFSVVDAVILRPLPYQEPGRLVTIGALAETAGSADPATGLEALVPMTSDLYRRFRERATSLDQTAGVTSNRIVLADENGIEEQVLGARVSADFFPLLGASPALGRTFLPEEYSITADGVAMITYEYWQSRYGGDPDVLGQTIESTAATDVPRSTIVGVLAEGFQPPEPFFPPGEAPRVYGPMPEADQASHRIVLSVQAVGRLAPGASLATAREEASRLSEELGAELADVGHMPGGGSSQIGLNDLRAETVGSTASSLWIFLGAAALLLALTAMNAAALFLARALDRRQELGVRMALGARRWRVVTLLLAEATLLSVLGGALGVALAYGGVAAFLRVAPTSIPRLSEVAVDGRVLAVAALATIGTALVAGLLPALRLTGPDTWSRIQSGGRTASEPGSRLRTALVGGQIALAMTLLCGAGLLFSSFLRIRASDPGFDAEGLIALAPAPRGPLMFRVDEIRGVWRTWDPVIEAMRGVPGVESAAGASLLPFQAPTWAPRLLLPGDDPETVRTGIAGYVVSPDYLPTMGIAVLRGRGIEAGDAPEAEPVVVVNEEFVRSQLGDQDPLGLMLTRTVESPFGASDPVAMRIVGVVENVIQSRVEEGPRPAVYLPYGQADFGQVVSWWSVVRTELPTEAILPELRRAVGEADRLPQNVSTMWERMASARATPRFQAMLLGAFAVIAMLLAVAGLHASLAHAVRRRQRELGVRMALGADRGSVLRMVLAQGLRVSLVGLALGVAATLALSRVLAAFLYDMEPYDPATLLGVAAVLILVSAAACLAPARRATTIDPVRVLNAE